MKNGFPILIEEQYKRAIQKGLDDLLEIALKEARKEIDYRTTEWRKDGINEITKALTDKIIKFENLKPIQTIKKTIENMIKSINNYSRAILKSNLSKKQRKNKNFSLYQLPPVNNASLKGNINKNVELILERYRDFFWKIKSSIAENIKAGSSQADLERKLIEETGVEKAKAKFWANDQLGKAYGDFNEDNQKQAGFDKFIWRTQKDLRVRDTHAELEGKTFSWDDLPIVDGVRLAPSNDYNCRCYAEPLLPEEADLKNALEQAIEKLKKN